MWNNDGYSWIPMYEKKEAKKDTQLKQLIRNDCAFIINEIITTAACLNVHFMLHKEYKIEKYDVYMYKTQLL